MKVRRVYVEKKEGFNTEALALKNDMAAFLGTRFPELARLESMRVLRRYDAAAPDDIAPQDAGFFEKITAAVLSEPQCDVVFFQDEAPSEKGESCFAVEYLPGQYDQRSDSAEQCAELVTGIRPRIRSASVYLFKGPPLSPEALEAVKGYLVNPVDSREASLDIPLSLEDDAAEPPDVPLLEGFASGSTDAGPYALAMSAADLECCRNYFAREGRDPSLAELRVLDTYWSDHCRHTTFTTVLENIAIGEGPLKPVLQKALARYMEARREAYGADGPPVSLMDMALVGFKVLKKRGRAESVDQSAEINACTIKINAQFDGGTPEPWLLLFKNETHNHPTEIEPFGGAATCLGGAIRDPLSGRAYVYQAMRITGGGDPRVSLAQTMPGKLPQLKIAREAAAGYSSYGNQIGLATGQVAEFYHPGFLAKRMELGAVIAAVPADQVRREEPLPGDVVILLGGKTGRDGIGGATGSSKSHTGESVKTAGAEVQKGNAVEERKLQRLFRNPRFTRLVKRCNDFGAGGVAVAVGELAGGLDVNLDSVPKKYAGLDGIELAISESQERMAVVTAASDADECINMAAAENLDAAVIAAVTSGGENSGGARLRMIWRGKTIVNLSRDFLDSNGASRSAQPVITAAPVAPPPPTRGNACGNTGAGGNDKNYGALLDELVNELRSLRSGSRRGLAERFDGSIGGSSVLFPWGGSGQGTPECGMAALLPSTGKRSLAASLMTFGYDPFLSERNPYEGSKGAVREALAKFACLGGDPREACLSFQEYFEHPEDPESWGKPAAALLGALEAQLELGVPAIGGKDSMSGNYRDDERGIRIAVPPSLAAFAAGTVPAALVRSGALSGSGNTVILLAQSGGDDEWGVFRSNMKILAELGAAGVIRSAYPVGSGGTAAALAVMAFGNNIGLEVYPGSFDEVSPVYYQGSVLVELDGKAIAGNRGKNGEDIKKIFPGPFVTAATTIAEKVFRISDGVLPAAEVPLSLLLDAYESSLLQVYPQRSDWPRDDAKKTPLNIPVIPRASRSRFRTAKPLVVLPVFPGTNCEWDMERAFTEAGAQTRLVVFRNRNREDIARSIKEIAAAISEAQILALPGGFSAGDEPDGSGKFIANVLRAGAVAEAVAELLEKRDGLMLGICNGFQALIKLGLVPYGRYRSADASMPTLAHNRIGRHVSRMVRTRVMSTHSPWLSLEEEGAVHLLPVSHGEGRLVIGREEGEALFGAAQIAFCYADAEGRPAESEPDNPNGSDFAIEGI
ncbi:MAG: phosphoribosylformylglycinamidine synthase, partial [Treponema sp.]|nr:phosphoribosylformylglycinamidine synthase [Treponema sp.]